MMKKIVAAASAAALLSSYAAMGASAEESTKKTYKYVALGDSISAGYGLEADENGVQRALILNDELLADPVKEAYPAVFGTYLDELAASKGITAQTTNLSFTAYRAEDIRKVILEAGYKGEVAELILDTFYYKGASDALLPYHDYTEKYLPEADMVSICLGGNDIVMGLVVPMSTSSNPILQAMGVALTLTLFDGDATKAVGAAYMLLENAKDSITEETVNEAVEFLTEVKESAPELVAASAANVKSVIDSVKGVNSEADIALLSMFNPYSTYFLSEQHLEDIYTAMQEVFKKAIEEFIENLPFELPEDFDINDLKPEKFKPERMSVRSERAVKDAESFKDLTDDLSELTPEEQAQLEEMLNKLMNDIGYPFMCTLAGENVEPQIAMLNEQLEDIAGEYEDVYFVDISGITAEMNLDPHPLPSGHVEIAELMKAALFDVISDRMDAAAEDDTSEPETSTPDTSTPETSSSETSTSDPDSETSTPDSSSSTDTSSAADSSSTASTASSTSQVTSTAVAKTGGETSNPKTGAATGLYAGSALLLAAIIFVKKKSKE